MRSLSRFTAAIALAVLAVGEAGAQSPDTIRQYQLAAADTGYELALREVPRPVAGHGEVLVRIRAAALNRGDLVRLSETTGPVGANLDGGIPLSDGAGDVIAVGSGVTQFTVGDRVVGTFFTDWVDGKMPPAGAASARAGTPHGMASEIIVTTPNALLPIPEYMTYEEAAALPCTGVTAWNGLFRAADIQPGESVLFEGTGGMSTIGLQLTAALGARPIITSSSNEKLARARELGAIGTVNYRENPDWQLEVLALTNDVGVDHVLEIGGADTQDKAFEALAYRGHLVVAGILTGEAPAISPRMLVGKGATATGVLVGSRADFAALLDFMTEYQIHPVIDRTFAFDELQEAFDFMENGDYMGKLVVVL